MHYYSFFQRLKFDFVILSHYNYYTNTDPSVKNSVLAINIVKKSAIAHKSHMLFTKTHAK